MYASQFRNESRHKRRTKKSSAVNHPSSNNFSQPPPRQLKKKISEEKGAENSSLQLLAPVELSELIYVLLKIVNSI
jgi:hypothetical protein